MLATETVEEKDKYKPTKGTPAPKATTGLQYRCAPHEIRAADNSASCRPCVRLPADLVPRGGVRRRSVAEPERG